MGYEDINEKGSFYLDSNGARKYVNARDTHPLPEAFRCTAYETLRAFRTNSKGYGLCCTEDIEEDDVVCEAVGRLLDGVELVWSHLVTFLVTFGRLEYIISFDDDALTVLRRTGKYDIFKKSYIDATAHGNLMRLVNDETTARNLQLLEWPDGNARRLFLVANERIPAYTELTWDYGPVYNRHWLQRRVSSPTLLLLWAAIVFGLGAWWLAR